RPRAAVPRPGAPLAAAGLVVRAAHGVVRPGAPLPDVVPLRYRDRRRLGGAAPPHLAIRAQRAEAGGGVEPPPVVQVLVDVAGDAARQGGVEGGEDLPGPVVLPGEQRPPDTPSAPARVDRGADEHAGV